MNTQIGLILGFSQIAAAESVDDVRLLRFDDPDEIRRQEQINMINYTGSPDGVIRKDAMFMLRKALKTRSNYTNQQVDKIISWMDKNDNGEIDATEYHAYVIEQLKQDPGNDGLLMERLYSAVRQNGGVSEKAMKKLFRLDEYQKLLKMFDANKDGKLSLHEVSLEERRRSQYFDEKTDEYTFDDVDGDGMISVGEFAHPNADRLEKIFRKNLDITGDGRITKKDFDLLQEMDEIRRQEQINMINYTGSPDGVIRNQKMNKLRKALKKRGKLTNQLVDELISWMDKNGNGEIDATEYHAYAKGLLEFDPEDDGLVMERLYSAVGQNGRVSERAMKKMLRLIKYQELLRKFDVNKDGTLSKHELRTKSQDEYTLDDKDGDGMISVDEFAHTNEDKLVKDFNKYFDINRDGKITEEELDLRFQDDDE